MEVLLSCTLQAVYLRGGPAPDEQETRLFSQEITNRQVISGAILPLTREVVPSITPHGEGGVAGAARTDDAEINRAMRGRRKCWEGKDRCEGGWGGFV